MDALTEHSKPQERSTSPVLMVKGCISHWLASVLMGDLKIHLHHRIIVRATVNSIFQFPLLFLYVSTAIQAPMEEQADQTIYDTYQQMRRYIGNSRGIQGHQNSCYMDSTIFGLFALSDIFDSMFLDLDQSITTDQNRKRVADLLWKGIVNPLRKY